MSCADIHNQRHQQTTDSKGWIGLNKKALLLYHNIVKSSIVTTLGTQFHRAGLKVLLL